MKIWRMRIACWIPNATNTHTQSGYLTLIVFPLQQWLQERASTLRYYTLDKCCVNLNSQFLSQPTLA